MCTIQYTGPLRPIVKHFLIIHIPASFLLHSFVFLHVPTFQSGEVPKVHSISFQLYFKYQIPWSLCFTGPFFSQSEPICFSDYVLSMSSPWSSCTRLYADVGVDPPESRPFFLRRMHLHSTRAPRAAANMLKAAPKPRMRAVWPCCERRGQAKVDSGTDRTPWPATVDGLWHLQTDGKMLIMMS